MSGGSSSDFIVLLSWWRDAHGRRQAPSAPGDLSDREGWKFYGITREPGAYLEAEGAIVGGVSNRSVHEGRGYRFRELTPEELATVPDRVRMSGVGPGDLVSFAPTLPSDGWQLGVLARWRREHGDGPYRVRYTCGFHCGMPMVYLEGWKNGVVASWFRIVANATNDERVIVTVCNKCNA